MRKPKQPPSITEEIKEITVEFPDGVEPIKVTQEENSNVNRIEEAIDKIAEMKNHSQTKQEQRNEISLADIEGVFEKNMASLMQQFEQDKNTALKQQKQELNQTLEQQKKDYELKLQELEQHLISAKQNHEQQQQINQRFTELFRLTGSTHPGETPEQHKQSKNAVMGFPNVNVTTTADSDKDPTGAFGEAVQIINHQIKTGNYAVKKAQSERIRDSVVDFDQRPLENFCRKNYNEIIQSLDEHGRKQGFFQSPQPYIANPQNLSDLRQNSSQVRSDTPEGYLPVLSTLVRVTHYPGLIFSQFADTRVDFRAKWGDTIYVPRWSVPTTSQNTDDYKLSGSGVYSKLSTNRDSVSSSYVSLIVDEWGRGKATAGTPVLPYMTPKFTEYFNAYDLVRIMQQYLGLDYFTFLDRKIRGMWDTSSRILYNDKNTLSTSPTTITASDDGTFTWRFLEAIRLDFHSRQIPFWNPAGNRWLLVLNPYSLSQLKASYGDTQQWQASSFNALNELTSMLNPTFEANTQNYQVSGYVASVNGFDIFESNAFGVGSPGADGVQTETMGAGIGARTTRTSYIAGGSTIARGVSMPFQVRVEVDTDFARGDSMTWLSWESFGTLDVDPTGSGQASQQLRVMETHTLDTPV